MATAIKERELAPSEITDTDSDNIETISMDTKPSQPRPFLAVCGQDEIRKFATKNGGVVKKLELGWRPVKYILGGKDGMWHSSMWIDDVRGSGMMQTIEAIRNVFPPGTPKDLGGGEMVGKVCYIQMKVVPRKGSDYPDRLLLPIAPASADEIAEAEALAEYVQLGTTGPDSGSVGAKTTELTPEILEELLTLYDGKTLPDAAREVVTNFDQYSASVRDLVFGSTAVPVLISNGLAQVGEDGRVSRV